MSAHVTAIEYQGTSVSVTVANDNTELTAMVPEEHFFAAPLEGGQEVGLSWDQSDLHELRG